MSKKENTTIENIKESVKEKAEKVSDFAKDVEADVVENRDFKRFSLKVRRLNSKVINFESALYGIFDQVKLTLTYRIKDEFFMNELIDINGKIYQVQQIHKKNIMFPIVIDGTQHDVECKVASLKALEQVVKFE